MIPRWPILLLFLLAATARAAPPAAAGTGYDLIFADEFSGAALDTVKGWIDAYPWGRTHNHDAYMSSTNVILGDGTLTLRAQRVAQGGEPFTSGAISTGYSNFKFNGGYVEARILLPATPGSWPAFWGLDSGWPPEADIMEFPLTTDGGTSGYPDTDYHTAFHYTNTSGDPAAGAGRVNPSGAGALNAAYHTFGMHWVEDTKVTFYFDGAQVSAFTSSEVAEMTSMYLILNYAVGGWPGTPSTSQWPNAFADDTKVDWVRVWQQRTAGASNSSVWKVNGGGSWDTAANWTGIVPKYSGQQAVFGTVGAAATATVDWAWSRTVGGVVFDGGAPTTAYTLGGGGESLQLAGSNGTANAFVEAREASRTNQTIRARLELYNTTAFRNDMTNGSRLILSGALVGDGDLVVDGSGTVQFSNNNTYTGDTSIGAGQGPGVARVTRSRPFGTNGTVTLGPGGVATTARIEIQDSREVPNPIVFCGRNNTSAGIESLGGSNSFSGTISAQVGGGSYLIQSDAGLLTLSGADAGAGGVALRATATGSRKFTLQGDGNGLVSGVVENGNGAVSLVKAGTGTWTLGGANTYSGTTAVDNGTLIVHGSTGTGAVTVTSGTLGGTGRVGGAVSVLAGGMLAPGPGAGTLTVSNRVTLNAGSTTRVEIARGGSAGDLLRCTGALACGGTLVATNVGAAPVAGDRFTVMVASAVSGTFAATNLPPLTPTTLQWRVQYSSTAVLLAVTNPPTGFDAYVLQITNTAQRGAADDPDGDGNANLLEYATGGSPTAAGASPATGGMTNGLLALRFPRDTNAVDVTLTVQAAYALSNGAPWQAMAVNSNGVWSGAAQVSETGGTNPVAVTVRDTAPPAPGRFLRLRVSRP